MTARRRAVRYFARTLMRGRTPSWDRLCVLVSVSELEGPTGRPQWILCSRGHVEARVQAILAYRGGRSSQFWFVSSGSDTLM